MGELPNRDQLKPGMKVAINQRSGRNLTEREGVIGRILTSSRSHPHGIMVELENKIVGRVTKIIGVGDDGTVAQKPDPSEIPKAESDTVEFKSSFFCDLNRLKSDGVLERSKRLEKVIAVSISALANKNGGTVYVGVDDEGNAIGVENDYKILGNPNDDKFQNSVMNSIKNYIKNLAFTVTLKINLEEFESKKIYAITVPPSQEPIFITNGDVQEFYVRANARSEKFSLEAFRKYAKKRFD